MGWFSLRNKRMQLILRGPRENKKLFLANKAKKMRLGFNMGLKEMFPSATDVP